jgi:hypothetical protein
MSGGKGGSQTSRVEIPQWIEQPTIRNLGRAEQVARMGYQPYYGPEVAAFTPMQQQAMQSQYDAASAFGMAPMGGDAMAGMPTATEYAGGVMGYGSGDIFDQSVNEFQKRQPDQAAIYNQQFVGPDTGNYDFYAPGKQNPIMGSGGGKGGSQSTGDFGSENLSTTQGLSGYSPYGGPGQFTDYSNANSTFNPVSGEGIPVTAGGGAINPVPFTPSTTSAPTSEGVPDPIQPQYPNGYPTTPSNPGGIPVGNNALYGEMPDFSMPQAGMNMPSPGMGFNVPPAPSFSAPSVNMSQPVADFSAPIAPINLPMPDFSAPVADFSAPMPSMDAMAFNFEPAPMPQPSFDMNMQNPMMGFNAPAAPSMMPFNAPEFNQSQFGQPPAMQAQLPISAADFGQMRFGRPAGLFGMMGA